MPTRVMAASAATWSNSAGAREGMLVGDATEPHDLLDAHGEGQLDPAGHDGDDACQRPALDGPERDAVERDAPTRGHDDPGQAAQQAGLAGAVGSHEADALTRLHVQADVGQDVATPIAQAYVPDVDADARQAHSWYPAR